MFPEIITTARLALRPLRPGDAPAIFDGYAQDPEVTRYLTWRPHASIEDTHGFVRSCLAAENARTYGIVLRATDAVVGSFDLRRTGGFRLDCGYVLARGLWGRGLMTEALAAVAERVLGEPSVWRIGAAADVENPGSIRVMEKAGFQREGVLRRWLVHPNVGDAPRDCVVCSRTR